MRKWKLWYLGIGIMFLICGIIGAVILNTAPDAGLAAVKSVADLSNLQVRIEWAQGDTMYGVETEAGLEDVETASSVLEDLVNNQQKYIEQAAASDLVVLATATGDLDITDSTTGQKIVVDQVLRGDDLLSAGSTCIVWVDYGLQVLDGTITYRNIQNLMQPETQYLIFLENNSLNEISGEKNFRLVSNQFGYLPVPFTPDIALPDSARCGDYAVWAQYPAFVATDEIAEARNQIVQNLLQMYGFYEG